MERVERYIFCRWRERENPLERFPFRENILFISLGPLSLGLFVPLVYIYIYINYTGRNAVDNYL